MLDRPNCFNEELRQWEKLVGAFKYKRRQRYPLIPNLFQDQISFTIHCCEIIIQRALKHCTLTVPAYLKPIAMSCPCFIVPPHLLRAISESSHNPEDVRKAAAQSLAAHTQVRSARQEHIANLTPFREDNAGGAVHTSPFVPEHLLKQLSTSDFVDEETRSRAKRDLFYLQELLGRIPTCQEGEVAPISYY